MRAMSTTLAGFAALWMAVAMFIQPATAQVSRHIDLAADSELITLAFEQSEITINRAWPASVSPVPTGIVVNIPNYAAASVKFGDYPWVNYGQWVGAIRLEPSAPAPTVFLEVYSTGAHCCSTLAAISPGENGNLTVNKFPVAEGELRAELPTDIDGDGILDIVRERELVCDDDGKCAERIAIYNIRQDKLLDVTDLRKFQPIVDRYRQQFNRE